MSHKARSEFAYSRILMKIASLDDSEGQLMAVSDFADLDDDLCVKLYEYLDKDILCIIIGSYVQGREKCYFNCELYILGKRNAVMQFIIDTGASITCCRAKELGINLNGVVKWK